MKPNSKPALKGVGLLVQKICRVNHGFVTRDDKRLIHKFCCTKTTDNGLGVAKATTTHVKLGKRELSERIGMSELYEGL